MSSDNEIQPNTISYWEERTINIGDYESRKFGLSLTRKVTYINKIDKKLTISDSQTAKYYQNESEEKVIEQVMKAVKEKLDDQEFFIRSSVNEFVDTPNLHKVKDLIGIVMEDTDASVHEPLQAEKETKKDYGFDDVDFELEEEEDEEIVQPKKSGKDKLKNSFK